MCLVDFGGLLHMQIHRSDPFTAQDLAGSEKQKKTHASGERLQADKPSWIISDHFGAIYCSVSMGKVWSHNPMEGVIGLFGY